MTSKHWIFIIVVIAVLAIGGWYFVAKSKSSTTSTATPTPTMAMSTSTPTGQTGAATATPAANSDAQSAPSVTIQNFAFTPASISVKKGTTVTWTNKDSAGHTVTESDSQSGPTSGTLSNGQSYHFTFNTVGTFHYKCSIHPSMTGTVTVTE